MERKVGEIFKYGSKTLKVSLEGKDCCEGCVFRKGPSCIRTDLECREVVGECIRDFREDETNVVFCEIDSWGIPKKDDQQKEECSRVNHPKHYNSHPSGVECIEIVRHHDFNTGNAIKYLWRAGIKTEEGMDNLEKQIEDLHKAMFYINDEIELLRKRDAEKEK